MTCPPPLTPADCDLSNFEWFEFHHRRLRNSEFWLKSSHIIRSVSVDLWCAAWEQTPAASLPDNDVILAKLASCGYDEWRQIKPEILAAWVLCSDGRWYHPTLSDVACEAWEKKLEHESRRGDDAARKRAARAEKKAKRARPQDVQRTQAGRPQEVRSMRGTGTAEGENSLDSCQIRDADSGDDGFREFERSPKTLPVDESEEPAAAQLPPPSRPKPKPAKSDDSFAEAWSAWPRKDHSSKHKSLALWTAHRAGGPEKLAAVRAYLEDPGSKKPHKETGRAFGYVKGMELWICDRLDSFIEIGSAPAPAAAIAAPSRQRPALYRTEEGDHFARTMIDHVGPRDIRLIEGCELVATTPPTIRAPDSLVYEKLHGRRRTAFSRIYAAFDELGVVVEPPKEAVQTR